MHNGMKVLFLYSHETRTIFLQCHITSKLTFERFSVLMMQDTCFNQMMSIFVVLKTNHFKNDRLCAVEEVSVFVIFTCCASLPSTLTKYSSVGIEVKGVVVG